MTSDDLRTAVMRQRLAQGLAVTCTMPGRAPVLLYFASPESRDDFTARAKRNGAAVTITAGPSPIQNRAAS